METNHDTRKKDVLDDVLLNADQEDDPVLRELLAFIDEIGASYDSPRRSAPAKDRHRKKRERKRRSNSYLSPENFTALEQVKAECQQILAETSSSRVSKSRITDISLEVILKDFQQHREKSILARKLKEYLKDRRK